MNDLYSSSIPTRQADVVIIGAGLAGLTAARKLTAVPGRAGRGCRGNDIPHLR